MYQHEHLKVMSTSAAAAILSTILYYLLCVHVLYDLDVSTRAPEGNEHQRGGGHVVDHSLLQTFLSVLYVQHHRRTG